MAARLGTGLRWALDSWERLVSQGIDTSAAFARDLSGFSARYYDSVFAPWRAEGQPAWWPTSGAGRAVRNGQRLALRGVIGDDAATTFVVDNRYCRTTEVSFLVSDVVPDAGGDSFRADVALTPLRVSLAPGEGQEVTVAVTLDPGHFEAGTYTAAIVVRGGDETEFDLSITAEAPAPAASRVTRTRRT